MVLASTDSYLSFTILKYGLALTLTPEPSVGHLDYSQMPSEDEQMVSGLSTRQSLLFICYNQIVYVSPRTIELFSWLSSV